MSTSASMLPELRIALANFGPGDIVTDSAERWETAMRWDRTVSVLREWQPHIVLCQEISATAPAGQRGHLWTTANTVIPAVLDSAPLHLRPSRTRYSPQDRTLTPNYDVHDMLTCVGMEDVVTALAPAPHGVASAETGVIGRVDRIYLTRDLAGAAAGYVRKDMRDSEHQALMLALDGAKAPPEAMTRP